jgi:hypothetical protein
MMRFTVASTLLASLLLGSLPASAQTSAPSLPAVRHLVYRFGWGTKAVANQPNTGTTTIDITGIASDGGMIVQATDDWWNTVHPKQTNVCEVYSDGTVKCVQPPQAISMIQLAVVPLLGTSVFQPISANPNAAWKQTYSVRASFAPGASRGFAGDVFTWNGVSSLQGKGTSMNNGSALNLVTLKGSLKQQGGRYLGINQTASMAFDPRIAVPVLIDETMRVVPQTNINEYGVQLRLIRD